MDLEQPKSEGRFWPIFAAATTVIIMLAAIRWSLAHPYGIHWDEAQYFDDIGIDVQRLRSGLLLRLGGRILLKSFGHPPAFRLLALPVLGLFGFHTVTARLVSLACFGLSAWFIYLATRRIGTPVAGAFAVLVFSLSPEVVSASIFFSTDAPLYLATSAMLYYLFVCWTEGSTRPNNWIGLGLAIGLGFLSKASFVLIAFPVLAFWLVVSRYGHLGIPSLTSQRKAAALALLVAAPWWLFNIKSSIAYAQYARGFVRNSLGPPSLQTWMRWLSTVLQGLLGHGISVLIGLVAIACLHKVIVKREMILDPFQRIALGACACAGVADRPRATLRHESPASSYISRGHTPGHHGRRSSRYEWVDSVRRGECSFRFSLLRPITHDCGSRLVTKQPPCGPRLCQWCPSVAGYGSVRPVGLETGPGHKLRLWHPLAKNFFLGKRSDP